MVEALVARALLREQCPWGEGGVEVAVVVLTAGVQMKQSRCYYPLMKGATVAVQAVQW